MLAWIATSQSGKLKLYLVLFWGEKKHYCWNIPSLKRKLQSIYIVQEKQSKYATSDFPNKLGLAKLQFCKYIVCFNEILTDKAEGILKMRLGNSDSKYVLITNLEEIIKAPYWSVQILFGHPFWLICKFLNFFH